MRKRLLGIILMLVAAGLDLSGQDLAVERLMHQGDSLHRLYLFDQPTRPRPVFWKNAASRSSTP